MNELFNHSIIPPTSNKGIHNISIIFNRLAEIVCLLLIAQRITAMSTAPCDSYSRQKSEKFHHHSECVFWVSTFYGFLFPFGYPRMLFPTDI